MKRSKPLLLPKQLKIQALLREISRYRSKGQKKARFLGFPKHKRLYESLILTKYLQISLTKHKITNTLKNIIFF
jgi:hypothetical protein